MQIPSLMTGYVVCTIFLWSVCYFATLFVPYVCFGISLGPFARLLKVNAQDPLHIDEEEEQCAYS